MTRSSSGDEPAATPWFRRWFGEAYLRLYPHRDEAEAEEGVRLFVRETHLTPGATVLDLACGAGRHLRVLSHLGMHTVGLDLSAPLLESARDSGYSGALTRGDMRRLPFDSHVFSAVTSFFTSFGYFRSESDDHLVLSEIRRVLRPGGFLLLDFLNADQVREGLVPRDEEEIDGRLVVQERELVDAGRTVRKTIRIGGTGEEPSEVFHERVRLYSREELGTLLEGGGFEPLKWFGDYLGSPPDMESPRTIALARTPGYGPDETIEPRTGAPAVEDPK